LFYILYLLQVIADSAHVVHIVYIELYLSFEDTVVGFDGQFTDIHVELTEETISKNYIMADCCHPIPGDDVLGYIDEQNRVVIHKRQCPVATRLKSSYGNRIIATEWDTHKDLSFHEGMDFSAPQGTDVYATGDGTVVQMGWQSGYGNRIVIDHGFGYQTVYAHLRDFRTKLGKKVVRGEVIGGVGSTGKSTGPHLHYEVHVKGKVVNPVNYYFMDLSAEDYDRMIQIAANHGKVLD
jgi:murein DD-endopeptidase MepM/ murein hydrolase activator NlpD